MATGYIQHVLCVYVIPSILGDSLRLSVRYMWAHQPRLVTEEEKFNTGSLQTMLVITSCMFIDVSQQNQGGGLRAMCGPFALRVVLTFMNATSPQRLSRTIPPFIMV